VTELTSLSLQETHRPHRAYLSGKPVF